MLRQIRLLLPMLCFCGWSSFLLAQQLPGLTKLQHCQETIPGSHLSRVLPLPSGNYLIFDSAIPRGLSPAGRDIVVMKLDAMEQCIWADSIPWNHQYDTFRDTLSNETPGGVVLGNDGFVYLSVSVRNPRSIDDNEVGLIKMDTSGQVIWNRVISDSPGRTNHSPASNLLQLPNGNILLPYNFTGDIFPVAKADVIDAATGDVLHEVRGFADDSWVSKVAAATDSSALFLLATDRVWTRGRPALYQVDIRPNPDDKVYWSHDYAHPNYAGSNFIQDLVENDSGYLLLAGTWSNFNYGRTWLLQTNHQGDTLWTRYYNDLGTFTEIHDNPDGGYTLLGRYYYREAFVSEYDLCVAHVNDSLELSDHRRIYIEQYTQPWYLAYNDAGIEIWGLASGTEQYDFKLQLDTACCVPSVLSLDYNDLQVQRNDSLRLFFNPSVLGVVDTNQLFHWDFGDGTTMISRGDTSHLYTGQGVYEVMVWIETACGVDTLRQTVQVICGATDSLLQLDLMGFELQFSHQLSEVIPGTETWSFGNGITLNQASGTVRYDTEDEFSVCLQAQNQCGWFTVCETINVTCGSSSTINLPDSLQKCPDQALWLDAGELPGTFAWSTGADTSAIAVTAPGIYRLDYTNLCNEIETDSVVVSDLVVIPARIDIIGDFLFVDSTYAQYQWYLDSIPIPAGVDGFWLAEASGSYFVEVRDSNGCVQRSNSIQHILTSVTALPTESLVIYPNPVRDQLHLEVKEGRIESIQVWELATGRLISIDSPVRGYSQLNLVTSHWAAGIYIVEVQTERGNLRKRVSVLP